MIVSLILTINPARSTGEDREAEIRSRVMLHPAPSAGSVPPLGHIRTVPRESLLARAQSQPDAKKLVRGCEMRPSRSNLSGFERAKSYKHPSFLPLRAASTFNLRSPTKGHFPAQARLPLSGLLESGRCHEGAAV